MIGKIIFFQLIFGLAVCGRDRSGKPGLREARPMEDLKRIARPAAQIFIF